MVLLDGQQKMKADEGLGVDDPARTDQYLQLPGGTAMDGEFLILISGPSSGFQVSSQKKVE